MPGPVFIEGDTVALHPVEEDDHHFLYSHGNRTGIREGVGRARPVDRESIAEMLDGERSTAFIVCRDGDPVGYVWLWGIDEATGRGELGYWIVPDAQGRGYAPEAVSLITEYAFSERRLHKVEARVWETNEASQRVLEKLGFEREGTLRDRNYVDGEHLDAHFYGVLEGEWEPVGD